MHKRKICVVTGTRAEYGLLYWLMKGIQEDPDLDLQLVVTGMHLSPEFGMTYRKIEEDGFRINEKVEMLLSSDTPVGITKSIGLGVIGFADALEKLKPDILVVLGDRFEIFAVAQAAMVAKIPIAHIHGGETTIGAIDEAMRHGITKMAHIHFTAADPYRRRVIQLGEQPERVLNVGAPGLDNITRLKLLDRSAFEKEIDFQLGALSFLVTYHPATLASFKAADVFTELTTAIDHYPQAQVIFTKANADAEGRIINQMIDGYAASQPARMKVFTSMGQVLYLSAMKNVDVIIGNSSSGIVEAPVFRKPTINIGMRQQGRLKAASIIDCDEDTGTIIEAIDKALSAKFQRQLRKTVSLYGLGDASVKIKEHLKSISLKTILIKHFFDIKSG